LVVKLTRYERMLAGGCPVSRHELTDEEWMMLATVRDEIALHFAEQAQPHG